MSDIVPCARTRPAPGVVAVSPPPRTRAPVNATTPPLASPPARVRSPTIENALPLYVAQKSHNGVDPATGTIDPRFAPLIIVVKREWLTKMPEPYKTRIDEALTWTVDTNFAETPWALAAFFTEWALRHYCHKGLLADDVFAALGGALALTYDDWNQPSKSMAKIVDGEIAPDMTKSAGPFYLDTIAAAEKHYATRCRNLRPDQIP